MLVLVVVDVDLQAEAELPTVGIGPAHGSPGLVAALPTPRGIARAAERVEPLQQRIPIRALPGGLRTCRKENTKGLYCAEKIDIVNVVSG